MRASSGPYNTAAILKACSGKLLSGSEDISFDAISTDSRDIRPEDFFIPIVGENFDGHDFLIPALEAGARGCLTSREFTREISQNLTKYVLIQVKDTLQALSDLASAHRLLYPVPLIAVTGSSGKTTVKEMIASILSYKDESLVSQANYNNTIGLPMTILNLNRRHKMAVVEAGINRIGEMELLSRAASPEIAVITTIGPVHLEGLGSLENIAREKAKIAAALKPGGTIIIEAQNKNLFHFCESYSSNIITFGLNTGVYTAENVTICKQTTFMLHCPSYEGKVTLQLPGLHNVKNALAAIAATVTIGIPVKEAINRLEEFQAPAWRMEITEFNSGRFLIRDYYNANPQSTQAALEVLATSQSAGKKLALLGDMLELGDYSGHLHSALGEKAAELSIDQFIFVGSFGNDFVAGFQRKTGVSDRAIAVPDKQMAWAYIKKSIDEYTTILVKGSRAMKMEELANLILQES
jgi:UDP-N-acetylmuramoyl-tripeptide--D-alanyl-D-alanine ligase